MCNVRNDTALRLKKILNLTCWLGPNWAFESFTRQNHMGSQDREPHGRKQYVFAVVK